VGTDRAIAGSVAGIDVIIGGHSHQAITETIGETLVAATHSKGTALGRVRLAYDRPAKKVVERSGELVDVRTADWPPHAATEKLIAAYAVTINAIMDEPLGTAAEDLIRDKSFVSSKLGSWIADVMREATGADVALHNKTGIRAEIPKGPIRLREIYQVSPFGNTCVTLRLTGRELREEIEFSLTDPALGLEVSGIEVRYDLERPQGDRAVAIRAGGEPLDLERSYLVVTNSFLAKGGDGHRVLAGGRERNETSLDIMRLHADDVKRRGIVRIHVPARVAPAEPTLPSGTTTGGE
jgi:2',3'-cyclic-nucleotide 2'-phosphodiesterase (5'-nucleotidase family)